MARTGRPKIEIDKKSFESLVLLGFQKDSISNFMGCQELDIDRWCVKQYGENYDALHEEICYAARPNQDKEKPYTVYMHIAPNGKKYIGITKCTLNKRWGKGRGYHSNEHFSNAIKHYGWDRIEHAILYMRLTKDEAEKKEVELIKKFKTTDRRYGYNIEGGGMLNKEVSEETREKLRRNSTGVIPSEETRKKMSESHKGEK